jgi:hypothetical protein
MSLIASPFRKLSGFVWLLVLAGSIGYTTRYALIREDILSDDAQIVAPGTEYMLANEPAAQSATLDEQVATQANAIAEAARTKTLR